MRDPSRQWTNVSIHCARSTSDCTNQNCSSPEHHVRTVSSRSRHSPLHLAALQGSYRALRSLHRVPGRTNPQRTHIAGTLSLPRCYAIARVETLWTPSEPHNASQPRCLSSHLKTETRLFYCATSKDPTCLSSRITIKCSWLCILDGTLPTQTGQNKFRS